MTETSAPAQAGASPGYRAWILFVLILVYTFNFIDRQILGILIGPIKKELQLDDLQLGLLGGPAFALFYTLLGVPIAWLADRWSRTWIMTLALAVWSGFTAACGFVGSFSQLFMARMGVGVGEAGGVAPAYSLISDYFPARSRARALAVYSFGIPLGSAAGVLFGGMVAGAVDWRTAFKVVGLAGLVLVPLLRLAVRDPKPAVAAAKPRPPGLWQTLRVLLPKPSFWLISIGAGCSSLMGYGLIFWLPSFFQRSLHLTLAQTGQYYGGIIFVGGMIGVWSGGWLADRFGAKRPGAYVLVPALAFLIAIPCYVAAVLSTSLSTAFLLFLLPQALALAWLGPVLTAVQHLVPRPMRSTASALFLFINNLIGIGCGTLYLGFVSQRLTRAFGTEALKYAILSGLVFYAISAVLLIMASRRIRKDWVEDAAPG
jgi:MFS family permease